MAKIIKEYTAFFEGISDFPKTGGPASYQLGRSIDHRSDTRSITLNPRTIKESGTVIQALPKWGVTPPLSCNNTYIYDESGFIYVRDQNGSYTNLHQVPASHGNGLQWFGEDNFVYYTSDKLIGRYGPICGDNPTFVDDFFGSQGGVRTNTYSLSLVAASSQYASRADTATTSITGNLSIEAQIKPTTLPTAGNSQSLVSKWDENGNLRSYKFDISTISNYFGNGGDGALTIAADTTDAPIDSACTGTNGTTTLTATNVSFTAGQIILIHQTRGTGAGTWQRNQIQSYSAGTITLVNPLNADYVSGAQVIVMKQLSALTVNAGKTWTAKAWNGTTGGILAYIVSGTLANAGVITATACGFRGGTGGANASGTQGEGTAGPGGTVSQASNGNGGGGGTGGVNFGGGGGGGGGNGTSGPNGDFYGTNGQPGSGGLISGTTDLTTMALGGGGGGGGAYYSGSQGGAGGIGGGILFLSASTINNTGTISANGQNGGNGNTGDFGGGGGGAGGSVLLKAQIATLGTGAVQATAGAGGQGKGLPPYSGGGWGGNGATGRVHLDYFTSFTGTTVPTLDSTQDPTLGTVNGWILRLQLSGNGTAVETYSAIANIQTGVWQDVAVSWDATAHTAYFYLNGILLGQQTLALSTINDNTSRFAIGTHFDGTGTAVDFYDGLIDEVRLFSYVRTATDYLLGLNTQILPTTSFLNAYYTLNNNYTDQTTNANNLAGTNAPTFVTDTPFIGATAPLNTDLSVTTAGFTYTVPIAPISEAAVDRLTFTPTKDPQLSISVLIAAKGTGNWTITVHDAFNNIIAVTTVNNATLTTGYFNFVFSPPWRPVIGQPYHFHLTSTVADGTVTTGAAGDLETVSYRTFYQFLVEDTQFHPVANMLQFMVFGNERYVATLEATIYEPNAIVLPAGWKVRCFGYWNEYLAIGAWRGTTVDQFDQGRIFFWDGVALTYNFFIDVPEGAVNTMLGTKGRLFFIAGSRCRLLVYEGGAQARKIKNLINSDSDSVIDIYPGAMTMWRSLMRFGVAGSSNDSTVQEGVYTWGSVNDKYEESLSFDYPISTGTFQGTQLRIGMVATALSKLLIGWQDNTAYGVDMVDIGNDVYPTGTVQFLIEDDEAMYHQKQAVTVTTQFEPLVAGQSLTLKYKLDRASSWTSFPAHTTVGDITDRHVIELQGQRYREYQVALDIATSLSTGPTVLAVSIEKEPLVTERRVG